MKLRQLLLVLLVAGAARAQVTNPQMVPVTLLFRAPAEAAIAGTPTLQVKPHVNFTITNADGKITLTKDPCLLAGPWFKNWRAAKWMYRGKMYEACWSVAGTRGGGQSILVIDSDGQVSQIDPNAFAPDQGA